MSGLTPLDLDPSENDGADVSLYKSIASLIATRLDAGDIPRGIKLNETMVSRVFKVSRTPARQALETLAQTGLICEAATRGYITGLHSDAGHQTLNDYEDLFKDAGQAELLATDVSAVSEEIENVITRLSVLGKWRLSVRGLQQEYSVSKRSIEHSLKRLEFNGLLAHRKGGQWIIHQLDEARLDSLYDIRFWLEPNLLQNAVVHIPMDVIKQTLDAHEDALARLPHVSGAELNDLEITLHRTLLEYANNQAGMAALSSVNAGLVMSKHILASDEIPVGSQDPFIDEHIAVLGAVKRRRSEESKVRMQAHLMKSREKVISRLRRFRAASPARTFEFATRIKD